MAKHNHSEPASQEPVADLASEPASTPVWGYPNGVEAYADSDIVVGISGKYIILATEEILAKLDRSALVSLASYGLKHIGTTKLQSAAREAEKAGKTGEAFISALAATPVSLIEPERTIGKIRTEIAEAQIRAWAESAGKILPQHTKAQIDEQIALALPRWLEKRAAEVEAGLASYLAAGYEPVARGTGASKTEPGAKADKPALELDF